MVVPFVLHHVISIMIHCLCRRWAVEVGGRLMDERAPEMDFCMELLHTWKDTFAFGVHARPTIQYY